VEIFSDLLMGLSIAITPTNLLFLVIGAMVGMVVGMFPGLGPSAGIAILLPITFGMDSITAVVMLAAIYYAGMYGATITSILLNVPGASAVVASTFDGYPSPRKDAPDPRSSCRPPPRSWAAPSACAHHAARAAVRQMARSPSARPSSSCS
jgi:putative tricarboxylic transport membrane protein